VKKVENKWWSRFLKQQGRPPIFLKVDWDKWVDEDEEPENKRECFFHLYFRYCCSCCRNFLAKLQLIGSSKLAFWFPAGTDMDYGDFDFSVSGNIILLFMSLCCIS
jgi:hypothetical protein